MFNRETTKKLIGIFLIWFLAINLFAFFANNRLDLNPDTAYTWMSTEVFHQDSDEDILEMRNKWDTYWYLDIVTNGYSYTRDSLSNIVFFPLYPLLIWAFSSLFFLSPLLAGWLLSSLFLLGSMFVLYRLVQKFHPRIDPLETVLLLLIFPTAFFFNTVYTESIFLFITLLTFFFTFKKDYLKAGIFGFLVALTRVNGILILVPVLYEFLADKTNNFKNIKSIFEEKNFLKFAALFLVVLAPLGFLAYHHIAFGDFWAFFNVQDAWGRSFALNGDHFVFGTSAAVSNFILDLLLVSFAIIVSIVALIKLRVSYGLYMLAVIALPLSTGTTASIGRYILVLFPMYILIASSKSIYTKLAYTFVSILLLAIVTLLFVSNSWAG